MGKNYFIVVFAFLLTASTALSQENNTGKKEKAWNVFYLDGNTT